MFNLEKPLNLKIILGSTRQGRFSEKVGEWILGKVKVLDNVDVEILDIRDYELPFLYSEVSPSQSKGVYNDDLIQKWSDKVKEADGFIIVTPEYNHGYPAVLKNSIDLLYDEWIKKPVGFVSYGGSLGIRAVEQLRLVFLEFQMVPIRDAIHMPREVLLPYLTKQITELDELIKLMDKYVDKSIVDKFLQEMVWWGRLLKFARDNNF